jgi:predicted nucleic acid-binding protein
MEVLAGARNPRHLAELDRMLKACTLLAVRDISDFEDGAALFRACRSQGKTIRKLSDCLIAAVAIRNQVPVLHCDRDFDAIAQYTRLQVDRPAA